jgi:hypothetical protein
MDVLITLFLILFVVGIIWIVLRFILNLTMRIFSCGCSIILFIALVLVVLRIFNIY